MCLYFKEFGQIVPHQEFCSRQLPLPLTRLPLPIHRQIHLHFSQPRFQKHLAFFLTTEIGPNVPLFYKEFGQIVPHQEFCSRRLPLPLNRLPLPIHRQIHPHFSQPIGI